MEEETKQEEEIKEGEETPQEPQEEQETSEKPAEPSSDLEEKNRRLYARMKKAEEEAKRLKEELERAKAQAQPQPAVDPINLAKTVSALKDYTPEELDFIAMISRAKNIPPEEAVKTEEAKLYIQARREKVAKEKKVPEPSSPSATPSKELPPEDIAKMSKEEHKKLFEEHLRKRAAGEGV